MKVTRLKWRPTLPLFFGAAIAITYGAIMNGIVVDQSVIVCLSFIGSIALLTRMRLYLPHGESVAPASTMIAAALLLFSFPFSVVLVVTGILFSRLIKSSGSTRLPSLAVDASRSVLASVGALGVYYLLGGSATGTPYLSSVFAQNPLPTLALFVVYHMLDFSMEEFGLKVYRRDARVSVGQIIELFRLLGPAHLALISVGVLLAVLYVHLGLWALGLVVALLMLFRHAMRLYLDVAEAYDDTIKALSHAIDVHEDFDGPRTADVEAIARLLGRQLAMTRTQLDILSRAALLVNLGRIGMDSEPDESTHHATRAANILKQTEGLALVGRIVEHQDIIYSNLRLPPLEILLTQCLFIAKLWCGGIHEGKSPEAVLKYFKKESGKSFHPRVVKAFLGLVKSGQVDLTKDDLLNNKTLGPQEALSTN